METNLRTVPSLYIFARNSLVCSVKDGKIHPEQYTPNVPQDFHIGKSLLNSAWSLFLAAATSEIEVDGLLKAHYSLVEFHYVILFT